MRATVLQNFAKYDKEEIDSNAHILRSIVVRLQEIFPQSFIDNVM